jgi:hypothetical protein
MCAEYVIKDIISISYTHALNMKKYRKLMMNKPTGCTQMTDRECREEDCCMKDIKIKDAFYDKKENVVVVNYWSISCEK